MFAYFFKLILRLLLRQKFSSFVNLCGLAIGFATFILIGLYVYDEKQYDVFHEHSNQIYRMYGNTFHIDRKMVSHPALLYEPMLESLPEIQAMVRMLNNGESIVLGYGNQVFRQAGMIYADASIFDVFSFELETGCLETFSKNPFSILITREIAHKYFGDEDPLGLSLRAENGADLMVAGILKDIPGRSHLQFSILGNFQALRWFWPNIFEQWGNYSSNYYLLLRPGSDPEHVAGKILGLISEGREIDYQQQGQRIWLQPLKEIYLQSADIETISLEVMFGSSSALGIFFLSAVLILLLACFNYINLNTARSTIRARETGIRKVLGASRGKLLVYFMAESLLMVFLALLAGIALAKAAAPVFQQISGKEVDFGMMKAQLLLPALVGLGIVVGVMAGLYPAIILSGFRPVQVLKGSPFVISRQLSKSLGVNLRFRQLLIVLQFAISIGLVVASLVMYSQTRHAMSSTGFQKEAIVVVRNPWGRQMTQTYNRFRSQLWGLPYVENVSTGLHVPGEHIGHQGGLWLPGQSVEQARTVTFATVDFNYFDLLDVRITEGRNFDPAMATDSTQAVVINQSAARVLGLTQAVGTPLTGFWDGVPHKRVIGVVEDIHFQSLHRQIQPAVFMINFVQRGYPPASRMIMIKIKTPSVAEAVQGIQQAWSEVVPERPIDFFFLDERYDNMYRQELQIVAATRLFTLLAVLIACMGLLGTTVYIMEARKKEFGIRKVLGASAFKLSRMISFEFSVLIFLSFLIAFPLSYYFLSEWLDKFAYRINLSWWFFLTAGLSGWLLAMATVNIIAWSQTRKDPVQALKYE